MNRLSYGVGSQGRMQDFSEGGGGGVLHEFLMKGRGAREARVNFCGAHSNFSTDFIGH